MKVIFYVLDIVKTVLRHICMLCEHFKHVSINHASKKEENDTREEMSADKDINTEKGSITNER